MLYNTQKGLVLAIITIIGTSICSSAQEEKPIITPKDTKAIEEVMSGKRKEAKASWWSFNPIDSTKALQSAINSGATKVIIENMGAPWIVDMIQLASDQEIFFENGAMVMAKKGSFKGKGDSLFTASLKNNVILNGYGAVLKMHKSDYAGEGYEKAEWRHVIDINSCSNIRVYGLTLAESGGDGIYLGVAKAGVTNTDIHIKDVICDSNYRQGISVISAKNLLIENCVLKNTSGTAPSAGIDFEPNLPDEELVNCVMRNCVSENNAGDGFEFYLNNLNGKSAELSIKLENCRSTGDSTSIRCSINNGPGDVAVKGMIEFINCSLENSRNAGIIISNKPANAGRIRFVNCDISNPALNDNKKSPITFNTRHGSTEDIGGVDFVNCIIKDPVERIPINFENWAGDVGVADVTGSLTVDRNNARTDYQVTPELMKEWVPVLSLKKIPKYSMSGLQLRPIFPDATPDKFEKSFLKLRGDIKCVLYAQENDLVRLSFHYFQVGRYSGSPITVKIISPSGDLVHSQDIPFQTETKVQFVVHETGAYITSFSTGSNAVQITQSSHRLCVSSEDSPIHFIQTIGELYFYVPAGTREFGVKIFGDNSAEAVKATLLNSSDKIIETKDNITRPHLFVVNCENVSHGEIWKLKLEKPSANVFEDYYVQLLGISPLMSYAREALLETAK